MRWLMAPARVSSSSEPFFLVSASRTNRSAAFRGLFGREAAILVGVGRRQDSRRQKRAGPKTAGTAGPPGGPPGPSSGGPPGPPPGGPIRRFIARPSAAASRTPFFSESASRTNFSAALAASSGDRLPSAFASAKSRIAGARNIPGPKPGGGPPGPPGPPPAACRHPWPPAGHRPAEPPRAEPPARWSRQRPRPELPRVPFLT